jgi:ribose transport system permease protein
LSFAGERPSRLTMGEARQNAADDAALGRRMMTDLRWRLHQPALQKTAINVFALLVLGLTAAQQSDVFLTWPNVSNILDQIAIVVIIGCPFTLLMVSGAFDISVGGVAALTGTVAALLVQHNSLPIVPAFAVATGIGLLVGTINGILVVFCRINSFIATIGTMYVCRGTADLLSGGVAVTGLPLSYENLGNYRVGQTTVVVLLMFLFVAVFSVVQRSTVFGRYAIASGSNPEASFLSGVPVRKTQFICFLLTGAAAGFAGVIVSSRFAAGLPNSSVGLEFEVIVAAVVGGASLFGGEGRVIATFLGALIVGVLNNGLDLTGVQAYWQTIALGAVLVIAVGIDMVLRHAGLRDLVRHLAPLRPTWRAERANPNP